MTLTTDRIRAPELNQDALLGLLVKQVEMAWSNCLRGGLDGRSIELAALMRSPAHIGDLVLVNHVRPNTAARSRIGWLVKIEDVPLMEDGVAYAFTRFWTIQSLAQGGEWVRWENVEILRVIEETRGGMLSTVFRDFS